MRKKISVAMAAYNGENYIEEQIKSILVNLTEGDELIISLDPSNDKTSEIIQSFSDERIKLLKGPGKGLIYNFENAIKHTHNDIIFLSDQDDIWVQNKVDLVLKAFEDPSTNVVLHDAKIVDKNLEVLSESFFKDHRTKLGVLNNIIRNSYIGCCMAFRKEMKEYILPFPSKLPMHDQWIGLIGELHGKNVILDDPLILYRRHGSNMSSTEHSNILQMIKWRFQIISAVCMHKRKCNKL